MTTHGPRVSPELLNWIRDTVVAEVTSGRYTRAWMYSAIFAHFEGAPQTVVYQVKWDDQKRAAAAYGFQVCMRTFAAMKIKDVYFKAHPRATVA